MKKRDISAGILLVFIGILFLLFNLKIIDLNIGLFIFSIGLLLGYFFSNKFLYLISGLILIGLSLINLLNEFAFPNVNIKGFLFLSIIAIILFVIYLKQNNRVFFLMSLIVGSIAIYSLIREVNYGNMFWSLFMLIGISFLIYYLMGYRKSGIEWPKNIGFGFFIISFILFIASKTNVKITFWRFLNYIWPATLILLGGRIIYDKFKQR